MYPEMEFIGADVQEEMLKIAKERAEGLKNVQLLKNDEDRLPVEGNSVDGILLAHSFHELERPDSMLKEVMRVLRPGGRVVVVDWKPVPTPFVREYDLYPYHYVASGVKGLTLSVERL